MSSSKLIRWCGQAAMVGGVLWALWYTGSHFVGWGYPGSTAYERYEIYRRLLPVALLPLLVGLLGFHAVQKVSYGLLGRIGFITAFIGGTLVLVGNVGEFWVFSAQPYGEANGRFTSQVIFLLGILILGIGSVLLGLATLRTRILPRKEALLFTVGSAVAVLPFAGGLYGMRWASLGMLLFGVGWVSLGKALLSERHEIGRITQRRRLSGLRLVSQGKKLASLTLMILIIAGMVQALTLMGENAGPQPDHDTSRTLQVPPVVSGWKDEPTHHQPQREIVEWGVDGEINNSPLGQSGGPPEGIAEDNRVRRTEPAGGKRKRGEPAADKEVGSRVERQKTIAQTKTDNNQRPRTADLNSEERQDQGVRRENQDPRNVTMIPEVPPPATDSASTIAERPPTTTAPEPTAPPPATDSASTIAEKPPTTTASKPTAPPPATDSASTIAEMIRLPVDTSGHE